MAIELFGARVAPYAALSCILSFIITGRRSIYPSQIVAIRKSASIQVEIGKEIEKVKPRFQLRRKSLINVILSIKKKIVEKVIKNKR